MLGCIVLCWFIFKLKAELKFGFVMFIVFIVFETRKRGKKGERGGKEGGKGKRVKGE